MKLIGFALALGVSLTSQAFAEQSKITMEVQPYIQLQGCSTIPPRGYVVVKVLPAGRVNYGCGGGGIGYYLGAVVYDSYFDKPVGAQMTICAGNYPFPDGWYQVRSVPTSSCFLGQATALVIQRYS